MQPLPTQPVSSQTNALPSVENIVHHQVLAPNQLQQQTHILNQPQSQSMQMDPSQYHDIHQQVFLSPQNQEQVNSNYYKRMNFENAMKSIKF